MPERGLIILVAALTMGALAFLRPSIHGTDGVCNYVYARSAIFDGDMDFTNEYGEFQKLRNYSYPFSGGIVSTETGRPDNSYGPGAAILWSPFVLGARACVIVAGRSELDNGYTRPFEMAVGLGTAFWASLGLILIYLLLRGLGMGEWPALGGVAAAWLFTPLFFYMYLHPSMSHGMSFFAAALALYLLGRIERGARSAMWLWAAFGAALGLMILIRMQDLPLAFCLGAAGAILLWRRTTPKSSSPTPHRRLLSLFLALTGLLVLLLPQLAVWKALYGSYWMGPRNYMGQEHYPFPRYFFSAWFSPFHGLFYWHPALLAGLAGLCLWRKGSGGTRLLWVQILGLAAFVAQTLLIGSWWSWYGGASFGHRMFVSMMAFFAVGFAVSLDGKMQWAERQTGGVKRVFWAGAGLTFLAAVYWNLGLAWLYGKNLIPHEEPVTWGQMVRGLLVDLPRSIF